MNVAEIQSIAEHDTLAAKAKSVCKHSASDSINKERRELWIQQWTVKYRSWYYVSCLLSARANSKSACSCSFSCCKRCHSCVLSRVAHASWSASDITWDYKSQTVDICWPPDEWWPSIWQQIGTVLFNTDRQCWASYFKK